MICELSYHVSSVNDNDVTFVLGPSFFSFAAGGLVSSIVSLLFDAPSIYRLATSCANIKITPQ